MVKISPLLDQIPNEFGESYRQFCESYIQCQEWFSKNQPKPTKEQLFGLPYR